MTTERRYPPLSLSTFNALNKQREREAERREVKSIPWMDFLCLYEHRPITKALIDEIAEEITDRNYVESGEILKGQISKIIARKIR